MIDRIRMMVWGSADDFYIGGIIVLTVVLIGVILAALVPNYSILGGLSFAFLLLLIPAAQGAVDLVNNTVTAISARPMGVSGGNVICNSRLSGISALRLIVLIIGHQARS